MALLAKNIDICGVLGELVEELGIALKLVPPPQDSQVSFPHIAERMILER